MKLFVILFTLLLSSLLSAQNWESYYEDDLILAKEPDRPLVLVSSGSDWYGPCLSLEKEILQSDIFKRYAVDNYVLFRADFPRKKRNRLSEEQTRANSELANKFNPNSSFPFVVLVDSQEQVFGTTSYKKCSPKVHIAHLNSFL